MSLVGNSYSLGINSTLGNASATVAARNTSLTTTHMATFLGVSGNNNVQVMISSYPSTLGVGCSTPTTIQYTIGYVDQNGNSVTQAGTNLLQTIATNGGPTDTTLTDQLNVTLTVPANINNSTGISYATTYTAGTCTTTNPSYTAQLRVIY